MRRHMLSMCICLFVVVVVLMLTSQHQSDWINVDVISLSFRHFVYTCSEHDEQNDQADRPHDELVYSRHQIRTHQYLIADRS